MLRTLFFVLLSANCAFAGVLDDKLDTVVKQFTRDARTADGGQVTAAVFPYSCDEKLSKKRVDLAVSELLTARLMRSGALKLVERSQLDTLMKEQGLGLSGAIDSASAARVGKLAGAKLAVLGTVARVGDYYQISSKLVDTETSEITSASIVEVPLETFDTEASRYLNLVPDTEALGVYFIFATAPVKTKTFASADVPGFPGFTVTPQKKSGTFFGVGVGVKYQFARTWLGDLAIFPQATMGAINRFAITGTSMQPFPGTMDGQGARFSVSRTPSLSKRWRGVYGLGYQVFGFQYYDQGTQSLYSATNPYPRVMDKPSGGATVYGAFAKGGVEYKLKQRFAWALSLQVNQPSSITCEWETPAGAKVKVMEMDMPVLMADTALTLYF